MKRHAKCPELELLCGYAEGTLEPEVKKEVERHLVACSECLDVVSELLQDTRLLEGAELVAVPQELEATVKGLLHEKKAPQKELSPSISERIRGFLLGQVPKYAFNYKFATVALAALLIAFVAVTIHKRAQIPDVPEISTVRGLTGEQGETLISPKGEVPLTSEITFRWNELENVDFYEIEIMNFTSGRSILRDSSIRPEISIRTEDQGLQPNQTYYWIVLYHLNDGRVIESEPADFSLTE